jgi:hypothetical protein
MGWQEVVSVYRPASLTVLGTARPGKRICKCVVNE